jgi:hypothetical protein
VAAIYRAFLESAHNPAELGPIPLLCRRGDEWEYREECWLDDQELTSEAFRDEIWLMLHPGSNLVGKAAKLPGVKRLSQYSQLDLFPSKKIPEESQKISNNFQNVSPYIYAWLKDQKGEEDELREKLQGVEIAVVESLRIRVSLSNLEEREVERNWATNEYKIYLSKISIEGQTWWSDISQAIANILDRRADQEFYEILFRCQSDDERRAKLRQKGMKEENIEFSLNEYSQSQTFPLSPERISDGEKSKKEEPHERFITNQSTGDVKKEYPSTAKAPSTPSPNKQIDLIDPATIRWEAIPPQIVEPEDTFKIGGGGGPTGTTSLSKEEREKKLRKSPVPFAAKSWKMTLPGSGNALGQPGI